MFSLRPLTATLAATGLLLATHAGAQGTPDYAPARPGMMNQRGTMNQTDMMDHRGTMERSGMMDRALDRPGPTTRHTTDQQDWRVEREMGTLPPERSQGSVVFRTGGVGDPEDQAFRAARSSYPLAVEFTGRGQPNLPYNEHLANVEVSVVDQGGREVLRTVAEGPWLLARVPPGRYTVYARFEGRELTRQATVSGRGNRTVVFTWDNVG